MKKTYIIVLAVSIIFITVFSIVVYPKILKKLYPKKYSEYVEQSSEKYEIEEEWIYALIKGESNFNQNCISKSGAIGLMQIIESTAIEVSDEVGIEKIDLREAKTNIEIGTKYFSNLVKYFKGNYNLAITAYNAGLGTVNKWIQNGVIKEDGSDIENIPYKETNNYVRKILKNYDIYKTIYEK